jgi:hypothetical protein
VQECIPPEDDPFHVSHERSVPSIPEKTPSDGAQQASSSSSQAPELLIAIDDTFSCTSVQQTVAEVSHEPRKIPPVNPGPEAQRADLLEYIKQQLDCYGKEPLLIDRYQLLGPEHRATGGVTCMETR